MFGVCGDLDVGNSPGVRAKSVCGGYWGQVRIFMPFKEYDHKSYNKNS